jgi:hypothetical protein
MLSTFGQPCSCNSIWHAMEAIDFQKLLLEERRRSKRRLTKSTDHRKQNIGQASESALENGNNGCIEISTDSAVPPQLLPKLLPEWPHPPGFLSMDALSLKSLCENPPSIFYSTKTFVEQGRISPINVSDGHSVCGETILSTPSKAVALEKWLASLPSGDSGMGEWKTMSFGKRRVCMFGEEKVETRPRQSTEIADSSMQLSMLPPPLDELAQELVKRGVFSPSSPPNHVLLNEYQAGQGIMPHTDGPIYKSRTATLSLCSSVVMEFTSRRRWQHLNEINSFLAPQNGAQSNVSCNTQPSSSQPLQVLLKPSSLVVFQDDAYLEYCHGIPMNVFHDTTTVQCLNADAHQIISRGFRYSLTFRHKKRKTQGG